jgi:hypothetical protein
MLLITEELCCSTADYLQTVEEFKGLMVQVVHIISVTVCFFFKIPRGSNEKGRMGQSLPRDNVMFFMKFKNERVHKISLLPYSEF